MMLPLPGTRLPALSAWALALAFTLPAVAQDFSVPSPNVSVPAPNVAVPPPNVSTAPTGRYAVPPGSPAHGTPRRGRTVYAPTPPPYGTAQWRDWCARKYPTFDPASGLYTDRTGFRRPCS